MDTQLWKTLSNFVKQVCIKRDPTHGHSHMEKVAENSLKIFQELNLKDDSQRDLVITVAWLHDVTDYKYDKDSILKKVVNDYLHILYPKDEDKIILIENIIKRISYSLEAKGLKDGVELDWQEVLGDQGMLIRNIVSDADKLEAIGKVGLERCILYSRVKYLWLSEKQLAEKVREHSEEKLLLLKDKFIRTEPGKKMAGPLHDEFVEELEKLDDIIGNVK